MNGRKVDMKKNGIQSDKGLSQFHGVPIKTGIYVFVLLAIDPFDG